MFWKNREGVFRYYDGSKWRSADPIRVHRLINEHGGKEWAKWVKDLDNLNEPKFDLSEPIKETRYQKGMDAVNNVSDLSRKVFALSQVDDNGLTDAECVRVFAEFLLYAAKIQEEYRSFQKPLPVTASADGG